MGISNKVNDAMQQGSWIRKMFEEGIELKQKYGAENVFLFVIVFVFHVFHVMFYVLCFFYLLCVMLSCL